MVAFWVFCLSGCACSYPSSITPIDCEMNQNEYLAVVGVMCSLVGGALTLFASLPFWKVKKSTSDELKLHAYSDASSITIGYALVELHKRREDISGFEEPVVKMLLSKKKYERKRGLNLIDAFFPVLSSEINFNWMSPQEGQIKEIKERLASRRSEYA